MRVLDINDANICMAQDGKSSYSQPGVALVETKSLTFGERTLANIKLQPRLEQSHFWESLDQAPVHPAGFGVQTHADLIYRQLMEARDSCDLSSSDKVWVLVPSDVSSAQLALFYGIAVQAEISIADFVDRGVAFAATLSLQGSCAFVDVGLYRTVLTFLEIDDVIKRTRVATIEQTGLLPLLNTGIRFISERSLDASRFDPRKFAETEQQVFDQILRFIDQPNESLTVQTDYKGNERQVDVTHDEFDSVVQNRFDPILSHLEPNSDLLLTPKSSALPGLTSLLQRKGHRCHVCDSNQVHSSIARIPSVSRTQDEVRTLHVEIPNDRVGRTRGKTDTAYKVGATHILNGVIARSISSEFSPAEDSRDQSHFSIVRNSRGLFLIASGNAVVKLNGKEVLEQVEVHAGDNITTSSNDYSLISVQGDA